MCTALSLPDFPELDRRPTILGNAGVAITGREERYALSLWLQEPSAFWLHPEGPLSNKPVEQWQRERGREVLWRLVA